MAIAPALSLSNAEFRSRCQQLISGLKRSPGPRTGQSCHLIGRRGRAAELVSSSRAANAARWPRSSARRGGRDVSQRYAPWPSCPPGTRRVHTPAEQCTLWHAFPNARTPASSGDQRWSARAVTRRFALRRRERMSATHFHSSTSEAVTATEPVAASGEIEPLIRPLELDLLQGARSDRETTIRPLNEPKQPASSNVCRH